MRNKILKGWNTMRIIRVALGIVILAEGIHSRDTGFIIGGLIFSLLPVFNIGCCCGNSCEVPRSVRSKQDMEIQKK